MKESMLKKSFTERDVQRMRNLITGKHNEKTRVQSGYQKTHTAHKEGDIWEDSGKTWTIKDGIKQNITKLDSIKQLVFLPLLCPNCNNPMKVNSLNKKMYAIRNMCFDCVIAYEHDLKTKGLFEDYESTLLQANREAMITELERALDDWLLEKDTYVTEQGDVEDWENPDKKPVYDQAKSALDNLRNVDL